MKRGDKQLKSSHAEVTQADIDGGERASLCGCPVARALIRKFQKQVQVPGTTYVYVNRDDGSRFSDLYELPRSVQVKIAEFDMDGTMEPFEFDMDYLGQVPGMGRR